PTAAALAHADRVRHVRHEGELARPLDGAGDLALMATAGTGDPARADLAPLGDEPPQRARVLVVDLLDLVLAEQAGLAAAGATRTLLVPAPRLAAALLCHLVKSS